MQPIFPNKITQHQHQLQTTGSASQHIIMVRPLGFVSYLAITRLSQNRRQVKVIEGGLQVSESQWTGMHMVLALCLLHS